MPASLAIGQFCLIKHSVDQKTLKIRTSQAAQSVVEYPSCALRGGRALFYTQEEAAILDGFLSSCLNRGSTSDRVGNELARFQVGLEQGCLQKSELQWAEQMLLALKSFWWEEWEDRRALMNVLLKTQALLRTRV